MAKNTPKAVSGANIDSRESAVFLCVAFFLSRVGLRNTFVVVKTADESHPDYRSGGLNLSVKKVDLAGVLIQSDRFTQTGNLRH